MVKILIEAGADPTILAHDASSHGA